MGTVGLLRTDSNFDLTQLTDIASAHRKYQRSPQTEIRKPRHCTGESCLRSLHPDSPKRSIPPKVVDDPPACRQRGLNCNYLLAPLTGSFKHRGAVYCVICPTMQVGVRIPTKSCINTCPKSDGSPIYDFVGFCGPCNTALSTGRSYLNIVTVFISLPTSKHSGALIHMCEGPTFIWAISTIISSGSNISGLS